MKCNSLTEMIATLERQAAVNNLAGVLIHMNDTYLIDERPPIVPGMARVAGLAHTIREIVIKLTGEDRTLVLHSGDYLSPSAMSKEFEGAQMVDLLNRCGVDYATLGNHEFDFGCKVLWTRLAEARNWGQLIANLQEPGKAGFKDLAFWPTEKPFLALTGIAGQQTIGKAIKCGFIARDLEETVDSLIAKVRENPSVGILIVLSHMDRTEDKQLISMLNARWDKYGGVYVLGGHDHDINWREITGNCVLSKCLSNCGSISLVALQKGLITAPFRDVIRGLEEELSEQEESELIREPSLLSDWATKPAPKEDDELLEEILSKYRSTTPMQMRADFREAFERQIRKEFEDMGPADRNERFALGLLAKETVELAAWKNLDDFRTSVYELSGGECLFGLPVDEEAASRVSFWISQLKKDVSATEVIVDFSENPGKQEIGLDARDKSLRRRSTDFGNFVADAVRVATGANVALLTSGAFRIDAFIPARITSRSLRDVFVYDRPGAISVIEMTVPEVLAFYDHAAGKGGQGAFLQVSHKRDEVERMTTNLKVALIAHSLEDNEDGYQAKLISCRCCSLSELLATPTSAGIKDLGAKTMVSLIVEGAPKVIYSRQERLVAAASGSVLDEVETRFIEEVKAYRRASLEAGIDEGDAILLLEGDDLFSNARIRVCPDTLKPARDSLRNFIGELAVRRAMSSNWAEARSFITEQFAIHLSRSERQYRDLVQYPRYLDKINEFVFDPYRAAEWGGEWGPWRRAQAAQRIHPSSEHS